MNSIASITAPTTVHIKKVQRRQLATPSRGSQCCGRSLIELAFKRLFGKRLEADRVAKYCLELQKRKYTTRTVENRLTKLKSKVSTSTCSVTLWRLAVKYKLRQDSVHMMIILFAVIMSVVISENTGKFKTLYSFSLNNFNSCPQSFHYFHLSTTHIIHIIQLDFSTPSARRGSHNFYFSLLEQNPLQTVIRHFVKPKSLSAYEIQVRTMND